MPLTADKLFRVNISSDELTATLSLNMEGNTSAVTADSIISDLRAITIAMDRIDKGACEKFAAELADKKIPEPTIVAQGTPPVPDQNGKVEKLYEIKSKQREDERVAAEEAQKAKEQAQAGPNDKDKKDPDQQESEQAGSFYERTNIITVENGDELLKVIPPVTGQDGINIYGKPIPRKLGREMNVVCGMNVRQDGDVIFAESDGQLIIQGNKVMVSPKLEIPGNVDFSTGNVNFNGEVVIAKNVLDLFSVSSSKGSVAIHGIAEAATVWAAEDLIITGGIAGKEKGVFGAGKNIESKYITNAKVRAGGTITVHSEIVNCDLACAGKLTIETGPLVGGRAVATGGAKVKELGSEAGIKTILEVGTDESLREKCLEVAPQVDIRLRKASKVRQTVEPLLANQKQLNAEQKEKACELLYSADELECEVKDLIRQLRDVYEASLEKGVPEVEILGQLHAGVTLRFARVETKIKTPLRGPLKVISKKVAGSYEIFAVDATSGSEHQLPARETPDSFWETLDRLLSEDDKEKKVFETSNYSN